MFFQEYSRIISNTGIIIGSIVVLIAVFFIGFGGISPSVDERYKRLKILCSGFLIIGLSVLYKFIF